MLGVERVKRRAVAFTVSDKIERALREKLNELKGDINSVEGTLESGKVNVNLLDKLFGPSITQDLLEDSAIVHANYKKDLSDESKALLEKDVWPEDPTESSIKDEVLATEAQVANLLYGIFAVFGTGAAVFLALTLFSDWSVEWKMIAAILAAVVVSISELIYFIKNVC